MTGATARHVVRKLTMDDVDVIASMMARSFFDDPLQMWIFADEHTRLQQLDDLFNLQIRGSVPIGESYTDASRSCAAFWMPPGREQPDRNTLRAIDDLRPTLGDAVVRLRAAMEAMIAAHPPSPHFYLAGVGTDPPRQGQGLASAVMAVVLARCDAEAIPAYLESTKERNVPFYEQRGFAVTGTIAPAPDGPTMWSMWRAPRASSTSSP
jgi:GNAT superfamily N-acetyltransferase